MTIVKVIHQFAAKASISTSKSGEARADESLQRFHGPNPTHKYANP